MIIALTGHRSEDCRSEADVRERLRKMLSTAPERVDAVICGMANGVDLWGGTEALRLGLPVWAAKPWAGHGPRKSDVELYAEVIDNARRVINVNPSPTYLGAWLYQKRNEWMVDNATHVLAYYNGSPKGGTFNCLKYAKKVMEESHIKNVY
jgi:uncharacterized phage-like protein YoqJ